MTVLGLPLGILMGLALGLLGGGGSILAVPIFKYVLGFGAKEAIASSLVVVGVTSLSGVASHRREHKATRRARLRPARCGGSFRGGEGAGGFLERRRSTGSLRSGDAGSG